MLKLNSPAAALTLALGVFGLGLVPATANPIPTTAPILTTGNSNFQLAAVVVKKKVVVVKKKGVVKKTTTVTRRPAHPVYRVSVYRPVVAVHRPACTTVVRYVKSHGRMVKTVRRSC
jgi:hypothetical protein